jgi:hypothetical protein
MKWSTHDEVTSFEDFRAVLQSVAACVVMHLTAFSLLPMMMSRFPHISLRPKRWAHVCLPVLEVSRHVDQKNAQDLP